MDEATALRAWLRSWPGASCLAHAVAAAGSVSAQPLKILATTCAGTPGQLGDEFLTEAGGVDSDLGGRASSGCGAGGFRKNTVPASRPVTKQVAAITTVFMFTFNLVASFGRRWRAGSRGRL